MTKADGLISREAAINSIKDCGHLANRVGPMVAEILRALPAVKDCSSCPRIKENNRLNSKLEDLLGALTGMQANLKIMIEVYKDRL